MVLRQWSKFDFKYEIFLTHITWLGWIEFNSGYLDKYAPGVCQVLIEVCQVRIRGLSSTHRGLSSTYMHRVATCLFRTRSSGYQFFKIKIFKIFFIFAIDVVTVTTSISEGLFFLVLIVKYLWSLQVGMLGAPPSTMTSSTPNSHGNFPEASPIFDNFPENLSE